MHYLKVFILFTCISLAQVSFSTSAEVWAYSIPAIDQRQKSVAVGAERAQYGKKIELGKWYTNFQVCKDFSDQTGIPCLFFYENYDCGNCWNTMYSSVLTDKFREFQDGAGKIIYCYINGNVNKWAANDKYKDEYIRQMEVSSRSQPAYVFMKAAGNTFPYVVLYNPKTGKKNTASGAGFGAITAVNGVKTYKPEAAISWLTKRLPTDYTPPTSVPLPVDPASWPAQKPATVLTQIVPASVPNFGQYPKPGIGAPYGYAWSGSGPGDKSFQWCLDLVRTNMVKPEITSTAAQRRPLIIICGKDGCGTCSSFANFVNTNLRGLPPWFGHKNITTAYFRGSDDGASPAACAQARAFIKEKFPNETADPCHRIYAYGLYEDGMEYLRSAGPVKLDPDQYAHTIKDLITGFDNDYDSHRMTQFQRNTQRLRQLQENYYAIEEKETFYATHITKYVNVLELAARGSLVQLGLPKTIAFTNMIEIIDGSGNRLDYFPSTNIIYKSMNDGLIYKWIAEDAEHKAGQSTTNLVGKSYAELNFCNWKHVYRINNSNQAKTAIEDMAWIAPDKYTQCHLQTNLVYGASGFIDVSFYNTWRNKYTISSESFKIKQIKVPAGIKMVIGRVFTRYREDALPTN